MLDKSRGYLRFRLVKIKLPSGHWRDLHHVKDLAAVEEKYHPTDIYVSVSQWTNTHELRGEWTHTKNLISSSLWVETDCEDFPDPQMAKEHIIKAYELLQGNSGLRFEKAGMSGAGYYLVYSPVERLTDKHAVLEMKKQVVKFLVENGVYIDHHVTKDGRIVSPCADIYRVRRCLGTFNGKRNILSVEFDSIQELTESGPVSLTTGQKVKEARIPIKKELLFLVENKIPGTKAFVPHLQVINLGLALKVWKKYKLGDCYIRYVDGLWDMYGTKKLDFDRLVKVMKTSKSQNLNSFGHYKVSGIPFFDSDGNALPLIAAIERDDPGHKSIHHIDISRMYHLPSSPGESGYKVSEIIVRQPL